MGGYITQKYLEEHEAPAGVLLASIPPYGVILTTLRTFLYSPMNVLKINLQLKLSPLVNTLEDTRWFAFSDDMPLEEVKKHRARMGEDSYMAFLDMLLFALPRPSRVDIPMLVLGAENDNLFSPNDIRRTAKAYQAQHTIFSNMAHDMMLERGWQGVVDRILEWLAEKGL